ncbi:hypothetical protein sS8_4893 [Methylocaldum marinum]|uniref:Uncharacterized protein n=1 Tax=Methylocaldum marinum TaxID=1432792 RepID=A0A250KZ72_9GAMM|nr:hypothetical protein sS8_4893 [Methylocaldum marinum]
MPFDKLRANVILGRVNKSRDPGRDGFGLSAIRGLSINESKQIHNGHFPHPRSAPRGDLNA